VHIKLYSGSLAGLTSPVQNHVPMVIADVTVEAGVTTTLVIPANFNTFLYVLDGSVVIGEDEKGLNKYQVGWLDMGTDDAASELELTAGKDGVRFALYSGKPTATPSFHMVPSLQIVRKTSCVFIANTGRGK
jgi:redox-sensitive bicupin YhaK (pirin superfamily)